MLAKNKLLVPMVMVLLLAVAACSGTDEPPTPAAATEAAGAPVASATPLAAPSDTPAPSPTAAPTDTPQPTETAVPSPAGPVAGAECLVGTWEVADMSGYMASLMGQVEGIAYAGQTGYVHYTFEEDGEVRVEAVEFTNNFEGGMAGVPIVMSVAMDGSGTSTYTIEDNEIQFAGGGEVEEMTFTVTLNEQVLFSNAITELGQLFGDPEAAEQGATFTFACEGDSLEYTPPVENAAPVLMTRVSS